MGDMEPKQFTISKQELVDGDDLRSYKTKLSVLINNLYLLTFLYKQK